MNTYAYAYTHTHINTHMHICRLSSEKWYLVSYINIFNVFIFWMAKIIVYIWFDGELRVTESAHFCDRLLNFAMFKIMFIAAIISPDYKEVYMYYMHD